MKNKIIGVVVILIIALGGLFLYNSSHTTIYKNLQSQSWSLTDTKGDGMTVQFQEKRAQFGELGSYKYSVNEKNKTIVFTDDSSFASNPVKKFSITDKNKGYILKPLNAGAKGWGTVTLEPKK